MVAEVLGVLRLGGSAGLRNLRRWWAMAALSTCCNLNLHPTTLEDRRVISVCMAEDSDGGY